MIRTNDNINEMKKKSQKKPLNLDRYNLTFNIAISFQLKVERELEMFFFSTSSNCFHFPHIPFF